MSNLTAVACNTQKGIIIAHLYKGRPVLIRYWHDDNKGIVPDGEYKTPINHIQIWD